jgi:3-oxoacyl-[acyl-carrier protein] reductase
MADKRRNGNGIGHSKENGKNNGNGHASMRLAGKVAIITGAGRGIGQATALKFAEEGSKVVVCDVSPEWIEDTVEQITERGGEAMGCIADVRNPAALKAMVDATVERWGKIDCLVNNAGIVMDAQL